MKQMLYGVLCTFVACILKFRLRNYLLFAVMIVTIKIFIIFKKNLMFNAGDVRVRVLVLSNVCIYFWLWVI